MVCLAGEECTVRAKVKDSMCNQKSIQIELSPSKTIESIFQEVGAAFQYNPDAFELTLVQQKHGAFLLNDHLDTAHTLADVPGLSLTSGRVVILLTAAKRKNISLIVNDYADDDLILGASASPTMGEVPANANDTALDFMNVCDFSCTETSDYTYTYDAASTRQTAAPKLYLRQEPCNYVGLVNQAMTCYLNSLLQALYMTPEFRNALYNWEFDGQNQEKSIPFQLQKLFLNLQTSTKSAVETTDLTHSFGWDLQAAWEQHDIQELCRVMFDALEHTFRNTKQANLINDLYEGKMLDYVKCLECSTEKSREDTFLDIPLPVKPFGSTVAYNSVEEALRGFVQPETLDGNNQYFCEKCDKKCDAHKGLKFTKFPYLLTLHLKRFDFDYTTMHRIKLNDKVVFPEVLNLNTFIPGVIAPPDETGDDREAATAKYDDCSTTDSGSALDDESCQGTDVPSAVNGQDEPCQDDDEGIDVSSGNHHHENEKNRMQEAKGPYVYELFSIMIHSGSASGGHYYAYVKDFQKNQWFCFNDQTVTKITEDDIQKTYGGGPPRGYYSGAYTSSTNAYMLMYRQIDKKRNCTAMTVREFPPHLQNLLANMREKEETDRLAKEKENDMFRLRVYCNHPITNQLLDAKIFAVVDNTLGEIASDAYDKFKLKGLANLEDCRIVTYNKLHDCVECSFERDDLKFSDSALKDIAPVNDWFLEVRRPGQPFEAYRPGGVKMKVYVVDLETEEVGEPINVRVNAGETTGELKKRLAATVDGDTDSLKVILELNSGEQVHLDDDDVPIKFDPACSTYKLYVASVDEEYDKAEVINKMHRVIDLFVHIISIDVILPENDISTLEALSIPPLDINQNLDGVEMASGDHDLKNTTDPDGIGSSDQSNSEDSSLSDSDRTLIGDAPSEPKDAYINSANLPKSLIDQVIDDLTNDDVVMQEFDPNVAPNYYFKLLSSRSIESVDQESVKSCARIMVDKRTTIGRLKSNLEPLVGVPVQYFKLYRQFPNQNELTNMSETLSSTKDGERLTVKLGRVLKKNEMSGKVYLLSPDSVDPYQYLFECVATKRQTVGSLKRDILLQAKKQHMIDIPYNKCRLRKKNWKNPSKVYMDDQRFTDDIIITNKFEILLQELSEPEKLTNRCQVPVFVKWWSPSTLQLGKFEEVVLNEPSVDELKRRIFEKFDVPEEFIDIVLMKSSFPCDMNILEIDSLDWNVGQCDTYILQGRQDACVFFFKDSREQPKELTPEEKKEIQQKENWRLGRYSTKTFSPSRRERGLKIYLDTNPAKADNNSAD